MDIAAVEVGIENTEGVLVEIDILIGGEELPVVTEEEAEAETEKASHPQLSQYLQIQMWMVLPIRSTFHLL